MFFILFNSHALLCLRICISDCVGWFESAHQSILFTKTASLSSNNTFFLPVKQKRSLIYHSFINSTRRRTKTLNGWNQHKLVTCEQVSVLSASLSLFPFNCFLLTQIWGVPSRKKNPRQKWLPIQAPNKTKMTPLVSFTADLWYECNYSIKSWSKILFNLNYEFLILSFINIRNS